MATPEFNPSILRSYNFSVPANPSPMLQTFLTYVNALNSKDLNTVMAVFDDSLEHRILPNSLSRPVLSKRQYGDYLRGIMPLFKRLYMTIHEVIEADNKLTAHTVSRGESVRGIPYSCESVIIMHFTAPGPSGLPKISLVKEFADSQATKQFFMEDSAAKNRQSSTQPQTQVGF